MLVDTGRARTVTWPELGRGARVSIPVTIRNDLAAGGRNNAPFL